MHRKWIVHEDELQHYCPPGHAGTVNTRLVERDFCGSFEMLRGVVEPGGEAEPHHHEHAYQVIYVIGGEADVTLGTDPPVRCTTGTIIRIPPGLTHHVVSRGEKPYKAIVIYSPPLSA